MNDFVIYDNAEIIGCEQQEYRESKKEKTREFNSALLRFLLGNHLLSTPSRWEGFADWDTFSFRKSDLTDEGFELVRQCHDKWLSKIDRSGKIDMDMWAKALDKLRGR